MNDLHRTGCGCLECGPPRRDPVTFEWPDERDEVLTEEGVRLREAEERFYYQREALWESHGIPGAGPLDTSRRRR